jgi:hypothetical protein
MARDDIPICRVYQSWPDHKRAICECGWEGSAHLILRLAKRNARRHCAQTGCRFADRLIVHRIVP